MRPRETLHKDLTENRPAPVYLWYGEDRYTMIEALQELKSFFLAEDPSGSSIEIFAGKDTARQEEIVTAAQTPSFFSHRLVVVDGLNSGKSGETAAESEPLLRYCQDPNPDNCLLLMADKVNRTRKLYKAITRQGSVLEFTYPEKAREWQAWLREEALSFSKRISPAAADFLIAWSGHQTGILSQELRKCALYIGERPDITSADIEQVCVPVIETSVFSLLDAIAGCRPAEALAALGDVLRQEYYMKVHAMIVRHLRLLLAATLVRCSIVGSPSADSSPRNPWTSRQPAGRPPVAGLAAAQKEARPQEQLMRVSGIRSPYEARKIYTQAGRFKPERLAAFLEACLECEVQIKSGSGDPQFLLEKMVVTFCRG